MKLPLGASQEPFFDCCLTTQSTAFEASGAFFDSSAKAGHESSTTAASAGRKRVFNSNPGAKLFEHAQFPLPQRLHGRGLTVHPPSAANSAHFRNSSIGLLLTDFNFLKPRR